jgi:hypothetical protein
MSWELTVSLNHQENDRETRKMPRGAIKKSREATLVEK